MDARQRRLLGWLCVAICCEGYGRSLIVIVLPYVGRDFGAAPGELASVLALISAGSLGVLALGPLADRFGRRRLLLASVVLLSLLGAGTALAATLPALVAWQAAARMFQEGALFAAGVIVAEEMPAARRGTAQGLLGTVNSFGSGLGAFLLGVLDYLPFGWRGLCLVSALPIAFVPLLRATVPESQRWLARTRPALRLPPPGYRRRTLVALAVVLLAMSYDVAGFAFATYVPIGRHGWSPAATSAMLIVAGALGLPGWWIGGRLADRYGRRGAGAGFLIGLTLAEVAFFSGGPTMLWPGFAGMVFCQGGKVTVLRSWATELFPTSFRGAAAGWMAASGTVGGMAGLALAGVLENPLGGICPAISLVAMAGVVAAALAYLALPETGGIELEMTAPEPG